MWWNRHRIPQISIPSRMLINIAKFIFPDNQGKWAKNTPEYSDSSLKNDKNTATVKSPQKPQHWILIRKNQASGNFLNLLFYYFCHNFNFIMRNFIQICVHACEHVIQLELKFNFIISSFLVSGLWTKVSNLRGVRTLTESISVALYESSVAYEFFEFILNVREKIRYDMRLLYTSI